MRELIETEKAPKAVGPYSQAVKYGNLLFVSGQIPLDPETGNLVAGNISDQARRVLANLKAVIEAAGMTLDNVLKCTCFLKNMGDFNVFNKVYGEFFGDILPARECVEVTRLPKDVPVEVSAICGE